MTIKVSYRINKLRQSQDARKHSFVYSFKGYVVSTSADYSIIIWDKSRGSILHQIKDTGCSLKRQVMTGKYIVCVAENKI